MFRAQLDEDWNYWMAQYPEFATSVGYPGQNRRWTDYSPGAIDARAAFLKNSAQRLAAINRAHLGPDDQLSFELYLDLLDTTVRGLAFQNDALPIPGVIPHNLLMPINQLEGVQQDVPRILAMMTAASRADYEDIVVRLERVGPLVDQTIALMERGLAAGVTPSQMTLRDVPNQVNAQIVDDPLKSPMLVAFSKWPVSIQDSDRAALTARAVAAYRDGVEPAFRRLHEFLTARYLPACRTTTAVSALPDGASMYAYNVKWHTTTDRTPHEIHELDQDIIVEIDRYIVWPGQALGYKMGQLKIRELRTVAERRLGTRFDIRQFHDVVLGQGAVPLDVLERRVNAWMTALGPGDGDCGDP